MISKIPLVVGQAVYIYLNEIPSKILLGNIINPNIWKVSIVESIKVIKLLQP